MSDILRDDYLTLRGLGETLEDRDPDQIQEPAAYWFTEARAAREHVSRPAPEGELIAWLAFENAALPGGHMQIGAVDFIAERFWPDDVKRGSFRLDGPNEPLREFDDQWHGMFFRQLLRMISSLRALCSDEVR